MYNTTNNAAITPGYYYWNGSAWQNSFGNDWKLGGNAGTNPSTNFIGTTDAQPLVFKTNNQKSLKIESDGKVMINQDGGSSVFQIAPNPNTTYANTFSLLQIVLRSTKVPVAEL